MAYESGYLDPTAAGKFPANVFMKYSTDSEWVDIGPVRDTSAIFDPTDSTDILSDNRGRLETISNMVSRASFTALEAQKAAKLKLFGLTVEETLVAGTPVAITGEVAGTALPDGTLYTLANKNGDNTQVASIVVKDGATTLLLDTDYKVGVDSQGFTYIFFLGATTGETTIDYTYTPNEAVNAVVKMGSVAIKDIDVKYEAYKEDNGNVKTRTFIFNNARLTSTVDIAFQNVGQAGALEGTNIEVETDRDVIINDEILV